MCRILAKESKKMCCCWKQMKIETEEELAFIWEHGETGYAFLSPDVDGPTGWTNVLLPRLRSCAAPATSGLINLGFSRRNHHLNTFIVSILLSWTLRVEQNLKMGLNSRSVDNCLDRNRCLVRFFSSSQENEDEPDVNTGKDTNKTQ